MAYAHARPGGPQANGEERPNAGQAFAIVETAGHGDHERQRTTSAQPGVRGTKRSLRQRDAESLREFLGAPERVKRVIIT
jgi:hypothetical protein